MPSLTVEIRRLRSSWDFETRCFNSYQRGREELAVLVSGPKFQTITDSYWTFMCASRKASTSAPHTFVAEEQNPQCPS